MEKTFQLFDKIIIFVLIFALVFFYVLPFKQSFNLVLAVFSAIATLPVIWSAFRALKNKEITVDLLASIALVVSLLNHDWISAAFINLMLTFARVFGRYTGERAHAALQSLLKFRPERVRIRERGTIREVSLDILKIGSEVVVANGERISVDGTVIEGEADVDQSSLTGESVPVLKKNGDTVFSSTLNVSGNIVVRAEKVGKDTTLEKLINLVENSHKNKSKIRAAADIFAKWYVIVVLVLSVVIYIVTRDTAFLLSVLLVVCADDIAVAIPMAFLAAIAYAAKRGVIVKGGNFLEGLTKANVMFVDKTGTLTKGKFKVAHVNVFNSAVEQEVYKSAAALTELSTHPIGKAILAYLKEKNVAIRHGKRFNELPGKGSVIFLDTTRYSAGNVHYLVSLGVRFTEEEKKIIQDYADRGFSTMLLARDDVLIGLFACTDEIRHGVVAAIQKIKSLGVLRIIMLTGDNENAAGRIAKEVGVTEFHAGLSPQEKTEFVAAYKKNNPEGKIIMVGDGVNDAATLASADIGIAMGAIGSDAAIEAADIALMHDKFDEIGEMIQLGRYTRRIARQDFIIWGVTNVVGLFLVFTHVIGPTGAAVFNFATDFFPLLNSTRLFALHKKIDLARK